MRKRAFFPAGALLLLAGCGVGRNVPSLPGASAAPDRVVKPGETVSAAFRLQGTKVPRRAVWKDALGNIRGTVPLRPAGLPDGSVLLRGRFRVLEALSEENTLTAGDLSLSFRTKKSYPFLPFVRMAPGPVPPGLFPWISSGICGKAPRPPSAETWSSLKEAAAPILSGGRPLEEIVRVAGFLAPLRRLARPVKEPETVVYDALGKPLPPEDFFILRLDTARLVFLRVRPGLRGPLKIAGPEVRSWFEPTRNLSFGTARTAMLYTVPPRLTVVSALPYAPKRLEIDIQARTATGLLLKVEILSASPVLGRHPVLCEILDGSGTPIPCGIRIATAANGSLRWWIVPGPGWSRKAASIRVTDLLTGIVAERSLLPSPERTSAEH